MRIIHLLILIISLVSSISYSQLRIEITEGAEEPPRIAVIPFNWNFKSSDEGSLYNIISNDLVSFREFSIISPEEMLSFPTTDDEVFYRDWKLLGIDYLLLGSVGKNVENSELQISYSIFDISREKRLHKAIITGSLNSIRILAHKISDRIYEKVKGIPGIFSTKILYVAKPDNLKEKYYLHLTDLDGKNDLHLFSSSQPILSPDWSPSADKIAYVSFEDGSSKIVIQELSSGKREALRSEKGINSSPTWSPKGKYIAAVLSRTGNPDIFLYDVRKKLWKQLTYHYGIDTEPTWSPNGKKILFTSNRSGTPQIYEINISNGKIRRKTFEGTYNARARYHPDGKSFVLIHRENGLFHVAVQNLRNGRLRILTETALDESPTISPNGNIILYATKRGQKGVLAGIELDGGTKFILPSIKGDVREPSWSPLLY